MAMFVASLGGAPSGTGGATGEPASTADDTIRTAKDSAAGVGPRAPEGGDLRRSGAAIRVAGGDAEDDRDAKRRSAL